MTPEEIYQKVMELANLNFDGWNEMDVRGGFYQTIFGGFRIP